ncbi:MAG: MarR family transcriptional regulator [Burkholderiaceae bacterium]
MPEPSAAPGLTRAPATAFYRPNAHAVDDSVGYLMKQVMVSFVTQADKRLGAHGLTHAQWAPLMRLRVSGESTVADMARWLHIDAGATTRLIDRLEKKGLCQRTRCTQDRRVVYVAITPEGLAATAQAPAVLTEILNAHLAGFSEAEWKQLVGLLQRMRDNGEILRETT